MSIRTSLAWSYGSQALTFVISFASSIILARLLSPQQMGVFAFALAISGILSIFTQMNMQSYLVREGQLDDGTVRSIYTVNALMSIALSGLIYAAAAVEAFWMKEHDIAAVLMIAGIGPLLGIFEFIPSSYYQREMNYGVLSRVGIARTLIGVAVTIGCAFAGLGALSPAIGPLVGGLFGVIFYNIRRRREAMFRPTLRGLRPAFVFGFQLMSISGVAQMMQRLSDISLGRLLGIAALGLYARASNLSMLVFANVYGQATGVVFVKMARDLRETGQLHDTFLLSIRMITAFIWPLVAGIAVLAGPLIYYLYGAKWLPAAPVLSVLMIGQFIAIGFGLNWEVFVLKRETARQTRFEIIRAAVGLTAFIIGCLYSITAAAAGRLSEAVLGYLLYRPHMDRLAGIAPGELERVYGESLMLAAVAVAPAAALMALHGWAHDTPASLIALAVVLGGAGWLATLAARGHPLFAEVRLIWSRARSVMIASSVTPH